MRRKTTKHRRPQDRVLSVRVITKRTVWFGFLKFSGKLVKLACLLAVLAGAGWGVWRGIEHAFYKNPDFQLKIIDLNENPVMDEMALASVAGIDLRATPNLFSIHIGEVSRKLTARPEIKSVQVERRPPSTLRVRLVPRTPSAWIATANQTPQEIRKTGGMLVDHEGIAFPCPPSLIDSASKLPVIILAEESMKNVQPGVKAESANLQHCFHLLEAACEADPDCLRWIDSIRQANDWSLLVTTRDGTMATFGLGNHEEQMERLRAAINHAGEKGYVLDTINLIPKYNVPVTLRNEPAPPKAKPVTPEKTEESGTSRKSRDLKKILNRN